MDIKNDINILTAENFAKHQNNFSPNKNRIFASNPDDEIVVSGMGGRFPKCDNVSELSYHLYNKVRNMNSDKNDFIFVIVESG